MTNLNNPSVLDCVTVNAKHCGLASFKEQFKDMISDGSWAIRRDALVALSHSTSRHAPKLPTFIKDAMLQPIMASGPSFDSLGVFNPDTAYAVEISPLLTRLPRAGKNKGSADLMCRFDQVDGDGRVFANVHFAKLLQDLFPSGEWYATAPLKPLMLVTKDYAGKQELVAFFMPVQSKNNVPGFSEGASNQFTPKPVAKTAKELYPVLSAVLEGKSTPRVELEKAVAKGEPIKGKPAIMIPFDQLEEAVKNCDGTGFCLACGEEASGCEPDARKYECESCEAKQVYGAEEILIMGRHT